VGTDTSIKRTQESSGDDIAAFLASDSTIVQKVAPTNDDGDLIFAQDSPGFILEFPQARSDCMERDQVTCTLANTDYTDNIPDDAYYMIVFTSVAAGAIYAVDVTTQSGTTGNGLILRQNTERKHVLEPGTSRVLHVQSPTAGATVQVEYF
jgi:hypothetical protein